MVTCFPFLSVKDMNLLVLCEVSNATGISHCLKTRPVNTSTKKIDPKQTKAAS